MKACLFSFVFYIAETLLAKIAKNLCEDLLHWKRPACEFGTRVVMASKRHKTVVCDVDCSAVAMARICGGIFVASLQFRYIIGSAEHGGNHRQMRLHAFHYERIDKVEANGVEQLLCLWNKEGHGVCQIIDCIEWRIGYVHEFMLTDKLQSFLTTCTRTDTIALSSSKLHCLTIRERFEP